MSEHHLSRRRRSLGARTGIRGWRFAATAALASAAVLATGCGKPEYCSKRTDLQESVKSLRNVDVGSGELRSSLQKVQTDARAVAEAAREDFPNETGALQSSVSTLRTTLQGLGSSPTPEQLPAAALAVRNVVQATQNFTEATRSQCE